MLAVLHNLIRHSSVYALGSVLSKLISFAMLPIYTNYLQPADYGVLELLFLVSTVATMVFSLNLTSALPRFYFGLADEAERKKLISTLMLVSLGVSVLTAFALLLGRKEIAAAVFVDAGMARYFPYVFIVIVTDICGQVAFTYLRILEKSMLFVGFTLTLLILGVILNVLFLVFLDMGIYGVLYSMVISNGLTFLMLQAYVFRRVGFAVDLAHFRTILAFSLPLVPAALSLFILNVGNRFVLTRFVDLAAVGIYTLGYKFGMLLGALVGGPFLQAWEPKRVDLYENNPRYPEIFSRVLVYAVVIMAWGGLFIACLIEEIVGVMAAPEYAAAAAITPFIVLAYLFYNLAEVVDVGIFIKKKTYWCLIINATAAAVNVGLNFLLLPRMGVMGAAVAAPLSFLVLLLFYYFVSQHYLPIRYDFKRIGLAGGLAAGVYVATRFIATGHAHLDAALDGALVLAYPALLLLVPFFDEKEKEIMRKYAVRFLNPGFLRS